MAKHQGSRTHTYKVVNSTGYSGIMNLSDAINLWADRGWRLVSVVSNNRPGYPPELVLERPVGVTHPDD